MTNFSYGVTTQFPRPVPFPRQKKLLLKVVYVLPLLYPDWIKHETNITVQLVSPSEWTSNAPVVETSESIEPNDNNLKLHAIGYIFSKIF